MSEKRKIDDSELEHVAGANGEEIKHFAADPPDNDPPVSGIDRPANPLPEEDGKE